jgi:hypothetical protein
LGTFSVVILLSLFSVLLVSTSSPSSIPMIYRLGVLMVSQKFWIFYLYSLSTLLCLWLIDLSSFSTLSLVLDSVFSTCSIPLARFSNEFLFGLLSFAFPGSQFDFFQDF